MTEQLPLDPSLAAASLSVFTHGGGEYSQCYTLVESALDGSFTIVVFASAALLDGRIPRNSRSSRCRSGVLSLSNLQRTNCKSLGGRQNMLANLQTKIIASKFVN